MSLHELAGLPDIKSMCELTLDKHEERYMPPINKLIDIISANQNVKGVKWKS